MTTPTGTINNCPYCDAYTPPGGRAHFCAKQTEDTRDARQFQKLKSLRDHLIDMDTGSGYAAVLTWAIGTIERLQKDLDYAMDNCLALTMTSQATNPFPEIPEPTFQEMFDWIERIVLKAYPAGAPPAENDMGLALIRFITLHQGKTP